MSFVKKDFFQSNKVLELFHYGSLGCHGNIFYISSFSNLLELLNLINLFILLFIYSSLKSVVSNFSSSEEWLLDQTEKFQWNTGIDRYNWKKNEFRDLASFL